MSITLLQRFHIQKEIPVPLYYQFKKQLLELIQSGVLKEGDMLPPEKEISDYLGISRPTVRQALSELVSEGCLNRLKGRGTFITTPKVEGRFFSKLQSFNQEMEQKGMVPSTQVLEKKVVEGKASVNERLGIPLSSPLLYLKRLRFADSTQLVYLETYIPYAIFPQLDKVDFSTASLYDSLETFYGVRVNRVSRDLEAVNATPSVAALLNMKPGSALCLVHTLAYAQEYPQPVEYSIARYRGDMNRFHVELER